MSEKIEKKWMTAHQVAEYLSLSLSQVYNLSSDGYLPYHRLGKRMNRYEKEEIDRFIKAREGGILLGRKW